MTICWNKGSISPYNKKHHTPEHTQIGRRAGATFRISVRNLSAAFWKMISRSPFNMLTLTDVPDIPITK